MVDRESVRLAFVAALQHLTPAQRAVLILRDVLAWQASEVAELLEISRRGGEQQPAAGPGLGAPAGPETESEDLDDDRAKELLADYVAAFEHYDIAADRGAAGRGRGLGDAALPRLVPGAESIGEVIRRNCPAQGPGDQVLVPTRANGQPAFGLYMRQPDGSYAAFQLQVLTLDGDRVSHVRVFFDLRLFEKFGLPATLEPDVSNELPISSPYRSTPDAPVTETERDQLSSRLNAAYTAGTLDADDYRAPAGRPVRRAADGPAGARWSRACRRCRPTPIPAIVASAPTGRPGEVSPARSANGVALVAVGGVAALVVLIAILLVVLL